MIYSRLNITPATMPMLTLLSSVRTVRMNGLDISPEYQRDYIWSNEYKDQLILSIILNYPIGNIVINNLNAPNARNARQELVDGKQRITTILRFVDCGNVDSDIIDTDDSWYRLSKKISDQTKGIVKKIMGNSDPEGIKKMERANRLSYNDLPLSIRMNITSYSIPVYTMQAADPAQIRDYFKVLQNQEKLRAGEIINSLPDNQLSTYFKKTPSDILLEKLNYTNLRRAGLEKVYYSIIGMWFEKIQLNSEDKKTIDFVDNLSDVSSDQLCAIERLNSGIETIASLPTNITKYRMTRRTLNLLFGVAIYRDGYFNTETLSRVEYIAKLSSKLAAFNSSESDDVAFSKYFADEFDKDPEEFKKNKAPVYRSIFSATARSVTKADFVRVLDTLISLCDENVESERASRSDIR